MFVRRREGYDTTCGLHDSIELGYQLDLRKTSGTSTYDALRGAVNLSLKGGNL